MGMIKKIFVRTKKLLFFGCAVLFLSVGTVAYPQAFVGVSGGLGVGSSNRKHPLRDSESKAMINTRAVNRLNIFINSFVACIIPDKTVFAG